MPVQRLRFLNIDLELHGHRSLRLLLDALKPSMLLLQQGRGDGPGDARKPAKGHWAWLETEQSYSTIDTSAGAIVRIIERLPARVRERWEELDRREFCIGLERDARHWSPSAGISAANVRRVAAIGCSIRVVVYPMDDSRRQATPRRRSRRRISREILDVLDDNDKAPMTPEDWEDIRHRSSRETRRRR